MNRLPVALLAVALGLPATAMAQSGPSFILIGGGDVSVSGDVHKCAIAPIADLGPLNPALAGVSAELRIGARSYDRIYGKATNFGVEMAWPMAGGEVFGQLLSTRTSAGSTEVGGAYEYIPKGQTWLLSRRDREIYADFHGDNYRQLARKHHLSEMRIRQIIERCRAADIKARQAGLF